MVDMAARGRAGMLDQRLSPAISPNRTVLSDLRAAIARQGPPQPIEAPKPDVSLALGRPVTSLAEDILSQGIEGMQSAGNPNTPDNKALAEQGYDPTQMSAASAVANNVNSPHTNLRNPAVAEAISRLSGVITARSVAEAGLVGPPGGRGPAATGGPPGVAASSLPGLGFTAGEPGTYGPSNPGGLRGNVGAPGGFGGPGDAYGDDPGRDFGVDAGRYHTGGYIPNRGAPALEDVRPTLKEGEFVLSPDDVRNMGGPQGVASLRMMAQDPRMRSFMAMLVGRPDLA